MNGAFPPRTSKRIGRKTSSRADCGTTCEGGKPTAKAGSTRRAPPFAVAEHHSSCSRGVGRVSAITLQGVVGSCYDLRHAPPRRSAFLPATQSEWGLGRDCLSRAPCPFRFPQSLMRSNFSSILLNAVRADSWFVFRIGPRTIARRPLQVGTRSRPRGSRLSNDAHGEQVSAATQPWRIATGMFGGRSHRRTRLAQKC